MSMHTIVTAQKDGGRKEAVATLLICAWVCLTRKTKCTELFIGVTEQLHKQRPGRIYFGSQFESGQCMVGKADHSGTGSKRK